MGSTCCDCKTVWKTKEANLYFEASPIGDDSYFPPKSEVQADAEQRASFGQRVTVEGPFTNGRDWWTMISILDNIKLVRELKESPKSDSKCTCIDANGGTKGFSTPLAPETKRVWTKTRTSNKYWWRVSLYSPPFGDPEEDEVYTVPCDRNLEYEFVARIFWEEVPYSKEHKCGDTCLGDPTIKPSMFDEKDKLLEKCKDIAKDYKFP